jgi:polar amino acid transport system substrate-binding protein
MARIQARGYLVVGVDQTTRYFGYRDGQGNLVGFDDDVARQVATAIFGNKPNTIHFVVITSAQRIPDVQGGTVDLVADNMTITCDRLKLVAFSSDYYNAGMTILVPSNSGVTSVSQLGGEWVCAAHATTSINEIGQLVPHPGLGAELDRLPGPAAAGPGRGDLDRQLGARGPAEPGPGHRDPQNGTVHLRAARARHVEGPSQA